MILSLKNVHKHFGGLKAVNGASLQVEKGKITAIIGPNGSGKSTLFNVISHIIPKTKGKVVFAGKNIGNVQDFVVARQGIARTFQEVRLFHNLTIRDHIELALLQDDEGMVRSFFSKKKNIDAQIQQVLDLVGLDKPLDTFATDLSYGQRKLLDLAVAIAKPHKLLMLDEPVAGVNPKLRAVIKTLLKKLSKKGETILVIEHDMNFLMDIADTVYVLDEGKVIAHGRPKDIQNNPLVLEAYLGD